MGEELQTWRQFLGKIIHDPQERQRIAEAIGVNPLTLTRWVANTTNPRTVNIRALLEAIPQHRKRLIDLLKVDYPEFYVDDAVWEEQLQEIPSAFYASTLNAHSSSPSTLRGSVICISILQQMLAQLDPQQRGMAVFIAQCMPPSLNQKIRSLRKTHGRGTGIWTNLAEQRSQFYGAESQVGHAVSSGHMIVAQSHQEKAASYPVHHTATLESIATSPILQGDKIAGAVCVLSTQPNYLTPVRLNLITSYSELLALVFEPGEFYALETIELGIIPPYSVQQPFIAELHHLISQIMNKATREQRVMTWLQAELQVWREIEMALLDQLLGQDEH